MTVPTIIVSGGVHVPLELLSRAEVAVVDEPMMTFAEAAARAGMRLVGGSR